jgi:3'-phosphoadenosine 5'-phosphosulfate (PAPS) 3'-phosphatase
MDELSNRKLDYPPEVTEKKMAELRAAIKVAGDWAYQFNRNLDPKNQGFRPDWITKKPDAILRLEGPHHIKVKRDQSQVTYADLKVQSDICNCLQLLFPTIPVVSEEKSYKDNIAALKDSGGQTYFALDPIDGTSNFIECGKEGQAGQPLTRKHWSVLLGLVHEGKPVAGFAYYPELDKFYYTANGKAYLEENGTTTELKAEPWRPSKPGEAKNPIKITANMAELEPYHKLPDGCKVVDLPNIRNYPLSLAVAEGKVHVFEYTPYIKAQQRDPFNPHVWDVAGFAAILKAAGGNLYDLAGKEPLNFSHQHKPGFDGHSLRFMHNSAMHEQTAAEIAKWESAKAKSWLRQEAGRRGEQAKGSTKGR